MQHAIEIPTRLRGYIVVLGITIALVLCLSSSLMSQVTTADIVGSVTDPSGAIVANATVTAKNQGTAVTRTTTTGSSGDYTFTLLPLGAYTVSIEAKGFKTFVSKNVTLSAGDRVRVDAPLALGEANETVEVESTTPALQTDSSSVGLLINTKAVQDLPLNGRNVIQLVELSPGINPSVSNSMSSGNRPDDRRLASNYSANGQSDEINNNLIDGMDNNERFIGTIGVRPSIDAIQEVKVLTNLYTAEIGRSVGGVVDLITKSGTNNFHGSAFEFFRNDIFDSNTWVQTPTANRPKAELRQNQFGASIGGPIVKNKTFFFGDYEGFRQVKGQTFTSTVPTAYEETHPGDFSDLCNTSGTPGTACTGGPILTAGQLTTIGSNYLKLYPTPFAVPLPGIVNGVAQAPTNNFVLTTGRTQTTDTFDIRIDQHFNDKSSLFGRYSFNNVDTFTPDSFPEVGGIHPGTGPYGTFPGPAKERQQSLGLEFVHVFRPDLLLQLRAGFLRSNIASLALNSGTKNAATTIGFPCTATSCINIDPTTQGIPSVNFNNGYTSLGDDAYVPLTTIDNTFQYSAAVTWTKNTHSFKFGGGLIRRQLDPSQSSQLRGDMTFDGIFTGNSLADLLTGQATTAQRGFTLVNGRMRSWEVFGYAQDDWRATRWLTLNLGLRYDIFTPYTARNNAFSNFDPALGLLIGPALPGIQASGPTAGVRTDYRNLAPRIGFAASLAHGTVVRGGFGMSYFPENYASGAVMRNAPYNFNFNCGTPGFAGIPCKAPFATPTQNGFLVGAGFPIPTFDITLATDPANYNSIRSTPFDQRSSYLEQFSLQVQKDFAGNVATIGYVGNLGRRLTTQPNVNQLSFPLAEGGAYPFPGLPGVNITPQVNEATSRYNALQLSLERRLKNGLSAFANYTYAHNITNATVIDENPQNDTNDCFGPCHVDNGSGGFVTENSWNQYDMGNAILDIRHRVAMGLNYELPFGKSMTGVAGQAIKGWGGNVIYSWSSGFPFTVLNSNGAISNINIGSDRPNQIGSVSLSHRTNAEWFNTSAFVAQAPNLLGDERRNQLFGPPQRNLNLSVFKNFPVREAMSLQFRAEFFNLLNQPNFSNPGATLGQSSFGVISSTATGADMREIQFALKFLF
jgi:outer membrane receptor protein involved in Fe transport